MTFEDIIRALASGDDKAALDALERLLADWDAHAEQCRSLLTAYVVGDDASEGTERALFYVLHALGDKADTASHANICRLAADAERATLVLGEDALGVTLPCILISTFDGDPAGMQRLVEDSTDELLAGDVLLALAYLARTHVLADGWMVPYLASLLERPEPEGESYLSFGWVKAVSALGLAGLAPQAERIFRAGHVDPALYDSKSFWQDLRTAKADPDDMSDFAWTIVGPCGDAVEEIGTLMGIGMDTGMSETEPAMPAASVLQPLHELGRNDPCHCGSGKKFKKCCLGLA